MQWFLHSKGRRGGWVEFETRKPKKEETHTVCFDVNVPFVQLHSQQLSVLERQLDMKKKEQLKLEGKNNIFTKKYKELTSWKCQIIQTRPFQPVSFSSAKSVNINLTPIFIIHVR
jgi:hypothetical protein